MKNLLRTLLLLACCSLGPVNAMEQFCLMEQLCLDVEALGPDLNDVVIKSPAKPTQPSPASLRYAHYENTPLGSNRSPFSLGKPVTSQAEDGVVLVEESDDGCEPFSEAEGCIADCNVETEMLGSPAERDLAKNLSFILDVINKARTACNESRDGTAELNSQIDQSLTKLCELYETASTIDYEHNFIFGRCLAASSGYDLGIELLALLEQTEAK